MKSPDLALGKYQHYRNEQLYEVLGVALHSETLEEMVIYQALYDCKEFGNKQVWVRPKKMFLEELSHQGRVVSRFKRVSE